MVLTKEQELINKWLEKNKPTVCKDVYAADEHVDTSISIVKKSKKIKSEIDERKDIDKKLNSKIGTLCVVCKYVKLTEYNIFTNVYDKSNTDYVFRICKECSQLSNQEKKRLSKYGLETTKIIEDRLKVLEDLLLFLKTETEKIHKEVFKHLGKMPVIYHDSTLETTLINILSNIFTINIEFTNEKIFDRDNEKHHYGRPFIDEFTYLDFINMLKSEKKRVILNENSKYNKYIKYLVNYYLKQLFNNTCIRINDLTREIKECPINNLSVVISKPITSINKYERYIFYTFKSKV